ncbi:MAG: ATP-binding cassette domain-containing protein, partial [Paracoccaceae bacterium]
LHQDARHAAIRLQDRRAATNSVGLTVRLFLQSAIIALGAYLVLQNQLTPGAIIAATVLLARALGPLNMIGQNWLMLRSAGQGWRRTSQLLANVPDRTTMRKAAAAGAGLQVQRVTAFAPGARQATLRLIDFSAPPGQVVGIIGPSGAGKTTLLMALAGLWPLTDGQIRLGDMPLRAANASLTHNIGLLAQAPVFLPGTIAENIWRFQPDTDPDHVVRAAIHAAAHDHILTLSRGYDTPLESRNNPLAA